FVGERDPCRDEAEKLVIEDFDPEDFLEYFHRQIVLREHQLKSLKTDELSLIEKNRVGENSLFDFQRRYLQADAVRLRTDDVLRNQGLQNLLFKGKCFADFRRKLRLRSLHVVPVG